MKEKKPSVYAEGFWYVQNAFDFAKGIMFACVWIGVALFMSAAGKKRT